VENAMPSTHLSLHFHLVFSTKRRHPWIAESWQDRLYSYLGGIIRGFGGVAESIGGISDHIHILASLNANHSLAELMRELKSNSSQWIHEAIGVAMFGWQDGYGAFTVSKSEVERIREYIRGQKEHHRKRTFQEEYLELLRQSGIDFDERYVW
jgi:REP element-mobilizing transposase RayT